MLHEYSIWGGTLIKIGTQSVYLAFMSEVWGGSSSHSPWARADIGTIWGGKTW